MERWSLVKVKNISKEEGKMEVLREIEQEQHRRHKTPFNFSWNFTYWFSLSSLDGCVMNDSVLYLCLLVYLRGLIVRHFIENLMLTDMKVVLAKWVFVVLFYLLHFSILASS
ncbi:hypothetical protein POPTR_009G001301v4 [Populus trichocarpa]|jgi:hypothetical protein|uniref:Uncharacterized protein n=1 Tax=Populus trichocarpa TaxID=3694 RepID=A0ACC0SFM8_POPTR|nr:hypothetical protein POPTR_009G001301v4 [Populus trichocarpa]